MIAAPKLAPASLLPLQRARILTLLMKTSHTDKVLPAVSVIVPALNEASRIGTVLSALRSMNDAPLEAIVVDGGSSDGTVAEADRLADRVIHAEPGRARQMNAGAAQARGEVLWFLHADTLPAEGVCTEIGRAVREGAIWGRFQTRLSGRGVAFRIIERFIHWRALVTGIATGDQGIFVRRDAFEAVGGYPEIPLMEDVTMSRRLRRRAWPVCCRSGLTTSSRRWEQQGVLRTVWLMWRLRFAYWRGADPALLAHRYAKDGNGKR